MRFVTWLAALALAGLLVQAPAAATTPHCNGVIFTVADLYVDDRGGAGIWIYREDNSRGGLQSGDSLLFLVDPCRHGTSHDELLAVVPYGI